MTVRSLALALIAAGFVAAPRAGAEPVSVAVLPVVVHTREGHDYLRGGLGDMLRARLERVPGIRVLRIDGPEATTTEVDVARDIARARGADYVVFGSFTQFGTGASLDIHCARVDGWRSEPDGGAREVFIHSGTPGEIIPQLDPLAEKLVRFALRRGPGDPPDPVRDVSDGAASGSDAVEALTRRVEALERAHEDAERAAAPEAQAPSESGVDAESTARVEAPLR
ncbi:MAG: hypothetical protein JSU66_15840 [Deltaproteobacteria bacterium]|nr:MAG: hypothetical protein JSU66_15840 [Deltaproteobacteria bacterium]